MKITFLQVFKRFSVTVLTVASVTRENEECLYLEADRTFTGSENGAGVGVTHLTDFSVLLVVVNVVFW